MTEGTGNKVFLFIVSSLLIACSCSRNTVFTDNSGFPSEVWTIDNVVRFKSDITDTASINNISFTIRTGTSYPFRNIWLFVKTTAPNGKTLTDTIQYFLADEKGKWYGKGFGDIHELLLPFKTGVYFPQKGTYTYDIRHGMRVEDLRGVYDFGLRIEKLKKQ
jgi:gliding motility-associated lipoprotein GldH